jgi:hypothetical protein
MPNFEAESQSYGPIKRFVRGAIPLVVVCLLIFGLGPKSPQNHVMVLVLFVMSAAVLWFGWNSIRRCVGTRWLGVLLAAYLGFVLGIYALGLVLRVGLVLLPLFLLALPLLIYDLLFRSSYKGRFERARAERRHLRS